MASLHVIRFGPYEVDPEAGDLRKNGQRVRLQEQPLRILLMLLQKPGETVSREQMQQQLWPDGTFVDFEHGVNTAVRKLRTALGDDPDSPRFIETVPRRGYRFIAPFDSPEHSAQSPAAVPEAPAVRLGPAVKRHWKLKAALALAALGGAALILSLSDRTRLGMRLRGNLVPAHPVAERRLTANPDDAPVTSAVISPDGKYLAFTDKTGFYLRQVDGGETHVVPLPKGFDAFAESWFPDSVHLVVSWVEDPKEPPSLWEISVLGGTPRKLAEEGAAARLSPDGSKIAFLSGRFGEEIRLMRADGGEANKLVGATQAEEDLSPVAWAPDGRRLAYVRTTYFAYRRETKIEIADVGSGQTEVVLSKPGLGRALIWTHPGRLIYSLHEPSPNQNDSNLWWVQLDAGTARPLGSGTRVTNDHGLAADLSVTNDGKLLALRRKTGQTDVYVAELESGGKRLGTPQRLTLDESQDAPFSWTPDSKAVFFTSDRTGHYHIFRQAIDQTQPELLVGGNDDLSIARLTPDGSGLLYLVVPKPGDRSHKVQIMRVPLTGGPSQLVLEAPLIWNQQCARLPSTLCIYSQEVLNQQSFFSFDPMNGTRELLATFEGGPLNWSLSPDGKYLATVKQGERREDPGIQILSIPDSTKRIIPVPGWGEMQAVDWSADGKSLWASAFNKNPWRVGRRTLTLLNIDLNGKTTATQARGDVSLMWGIPSPDGSRLALGAATGGSNVWLLESF